MACPEHIAIFSGQTSSRMCPGPTPLQAGEKAQLLETECLSLKQRGVRGEERPLLCGPAWKQVHRQRPPAQLLQGLPQRCCCSC